MGVLKIVLNHNYYNVYPQLPTALIFECEAYFQTSQKQTPFVI